MSVRSGQAITVLFTTRRFDTGVGVNADSLPTGTLYVNGTAGGATVTVTNVTTGVYKAAVTLPTLAVGDVVDLRISATVNLVVDNAVVWRDSKDVLLDSSGKVDVSDKTGFKLASDGVDLIVVEAGLNLRQAASIKSSALAGVLSGAAGTTVTILGAGVATPRIVATVDSSGNRTAVTLTPPV
jgi:hypothetical protein